MRTAVVHDWLTVSAGAEKVTRELVDLFDADVFAIVDFLNEEDRRSILRGKHAKTTFIQRIPFARHFFRYLLPLFPKAIEGLDLRGYDLVLSSSYAVAKGARIPPGAKHVCYIHTPMRYAWVDEEGYLDAHRVHGLFGWLVRWQLRRLRRWDLSTTPHVDRFIANSANVAARVERSYGRTADVVLPPVDMDLFTLHTGSRDGYVTVSRLVPYKRIDLIIGAFRSMPEKRLTVVGDGPERERLRRMAPSNVMFTGNLPQAGVISHLQQALALIVAANEDLGLTPLEAQACGTPVIALGKGGYLETVTHGENGILFPDDSARAIVEAVERFERLGVSRGPSALREGVVPCSVKRFRERISLLVNETMGHAR